jgi:cobalt-zinc-cadmium efflux system outer membrane protein
MRLRLRLGILVILGALSWQVAAAANSAAASGADSAAAIDALSILPPETVVRQTLEKLPQLRSSAMNIDLAKSGKARLESGSYEWSVRAGASRRTDQSGDRFDEQELLVERPVRWFGKADKDLAIGNKGMLMAEAGYADAWHEAGRGLMKDWFDALREMAATRKLTEQREVAERLLMIAEKRVKAGDAARLELLQADTESKRVAAMVQQSQLRQDQAMQMLALSYPGLPQPRITTLPAPQPLLESRAYWFDKITNDNHELTLAQAEADLLLLQAGRVASDRMPDPTVGLRTSRERSGRENVYSIVIAIPFAGPARTADANSATLKANMASERVTQTQIRITSAAQRLITESSRTYDIWQTMARIQQQSQQQAAIMMSAYQLGEATITDALNTRRQALDAALAAESAQIDALAAYARLRLDAHLLWSFE